MRGQLLLPLLHVLLQPPPQHLLLLLLLLLEELPSYQRYPLLQALSPWQQMPP
jgi:hypothetical protein